MDHIDDAPGRTHSWANHVPKRVQENPALDEIADERRAGSCRSRVRDASSASELLATTAQLAVQCASREPRIRKQR